MRIFSVIPRTGRRPDRHASRSAAAVGMAMLVVCSLLLTGCSGGSAADTAPTENQTGLKSFGDLPSIGGTRASAGGSPAGSKYPMIYLEGSDSHQTDISQPLGAVPGGMMRISLGGLSVAVPDDYEIEEWPEEGAINATEPGYPAVINLVELQCYEFKDQTIALQWMEMEYETARRMFTHDSSCAFYVETEMPCDGYTLHYLSGHGPAVDGGRDVYYVDSTIYMIYNGRQIFYVVLRSDGSDPYMSKVEATIRFDPGMYYEIPKPSQAPSSPYGQPVGSGSGAPVPID